MIVLLHHPLQAWLFGTLFLIWLIPELISIATQRSSKAAVRRDRGSIYLLALLVFFGMSIAILCPFVIPLIFLWASTSDQ